MVESQAFRQKYRTVFTVLAGLFGFLLTSAWVCFGLTNHFAKGSTGYAGALAALGGITTSSVVHCCMIATHIMTAKYDKGHGCCNHYGTVWIASWFPITTIMASVAIIICSIIFGIRYEHTVDTDKQVNKDENEIMGIVNLVVGIIANLVGSVALHFGITLKREFEKAKENQGPFADISPKDNSFGHI